MDPLRILQERFGHDTFRGPQRPVIDRVLGGGHAMVIMPTGSGKSLCYQVPALACDGLTVVISPLIALMKDQVDALRRRGVDAAFINASLKRAQREKAYADLAAGRFDLLYVTPERFRKPEFREAIAARRIALLAVDEAHCVSAWGHDFRPDYTRLADIRALLGEPPTLALTATATPTVRADIIRQLGLRPADMPLFHDGVARPNLELRVEEVWGDDDKLQHIRRTLDDVPGPAVVYFSLIRTLIAFSEKLQSLGVPHARYHGDLDPAQRRRVQDAFMSGGERVILATNAFGMGVDKADIRSVVHAEVPGSVEAYYQEIGRAGRDGLPSRPVLLYDENDLTIQMNFIAWSNPDADYYRRAFDLIRHDGERVAAFGLDWLREKLHHKQRHDFRLDTALAMMERHDAVERDERGVPRPTGPLPAALTDPAHLEAKITADRQKLLHMVQYVRHEGDRHEFFSRYFDLGAAPEEPAADLV